MKRDPVRGKLHVGAEVVDGEGTFFRVWAPGKRSIDIVIEETGVRIPLQDERNEYFSGFGAGVAPSMRYRYSIDGSDELYPDPASRFQPEGPLGPSEVIDPAFPWTDESWRGVDRYGQVIYELHVGTFTPEGTFEAASRELRRLAEIGITVVELMPVADFAGEFGWGYDGVNLFAPSRLYGTPDDFRRFVDRAHACGIGVILDVVYNHLGGVGNFATKFSELYFTDRYENEWGEAVNFDGPGSEAVREYVAANAEYWIREFHLDGYRVDATQQIFDSSPDNIMAVLTRRARAAAGSRPILVVAENEPQDNRIVRPESKKGYGMDALWNDDFHHSAMVVLSGRNEAYYTDYLGKAQEFISAAKWGYLYQGQRYKWQRKRRGTPGLDLEPANYITYIQNHDQIANTARGFRAHRISSFGRYKALTALMLLGPSTPMLFQGQEFGASTPFYYFGDFEGRLREEVHAGRKKSLVQFRSYATDEVQRAILDPADPKTFSMSKLIPSEREANVEFVKLHTDLLRIRREDPVISRSVGRARKLDGAVLGEEAFVLRYFGEDFGDRLLVVNFGRDLQLDPAPEPLLAPVEGMRWSEVWSSENLEYGGSGTAPLDSEENWRIPGHAAVLLGPVTAPPEKEHRKESKR